MNNLKKTISRVMIIALTAYSLMSGISANASAKGVIVPQPTVKDLNATYKYKSTIKLNIATTNYTRKVKYRVSLYNFSTKESINLTKGYSKSIGGSKILILNTAPKTSGKYELRVYVKALASKSNYDKYFKKIFTVEANKSDIAAAILSASSLEKSVKVGSHIGDILGSDKAKFQGVIHEGLLVKNNVYASQSTVDAKIKALKVAAINFKNSIKQPVDNTALITAIKAAQEKLNRTLTEPLETQLAIKYDKNVLSLETGASIKVVVNRNATVEEVRVAVIRLNDSIAIFTNKILEVKSNS